MEQTPIRRQRRWVGVAQLAGLGPVAEASQHDYRLRGNYTIPPSPRSARNR